MESLYDRYDKLIRYLVRRAGLPSSIDEDDVVQSVWLKLLEHKPKLDPDMKGAKSYIGKTVKTVIADAYTDNPLSEPLKDIAVSPRDPDFETHEEVSAVLDNLKQPDRRLLTKRYLKGISKRQLARDRGVSRQRVDSDIDKALKRAKQRS